MFKPSLIFLALLLATGCAAVRPSIVTRAMHEDIREAKRLLQAGHYRQAVDELTMLIEMDPGNEEARSGRASAYQSLEEFPLAIQDYEEILRRNPSSSKTHYNLGMIYAFKLNEPRKGLEHFDRFLSLEPGHPKGFSVAKIMCSLDGVDGGTGFNDTGFEEAVNEIAKIPNLEERKEGLLAEARRNPENPLPYFLIGKTYEYEGRPDEAIRAFQTALALRPTCAPCHQSLGKILIRKKKTALGRIHLLKAGLFNPREAGT